MMGIQSTKLMCTPEPLRVDLENTAASRKKKKPRENYSKVSVAGEQEQGKWTYECARRVDACGAGGCAVEPGGLGEAEEAVVVLHCIVWVQWLPNDRGLRSGLEGRSDVVIMAEVRWKCGLAPTMA